MFDPLAAVDATVLHIFLLLWDPILSDGPHLAVNIKPIHGHKFPKILTRVSAIYIVSAKLLYYLDHNMCCAYVYDAVIYLPARCCFVAPHSEPMALLPVYWENEDVFL